MCTLIGSNCSSEKQNRHRSNTDNDQFNRYNNVTKQMSTFVFFLGSNESYDLIIHF